jgi:heme O synthase-like polyprenyltransferase
MLNETYPNQRPERRRRVGMPEVAFVAGFVLAVAGLAIVAIPVALLAAGIVLMAVAWRAA